MGRRPGKYVRPLSKDDRDALEQLKEEGKTPRIRHRAHAVLLSDSGKSIDELAEIFEVHRVTVSGWLDRWDNEGLTGLEDVHRPGAPPALTESEQQQVLQWLDENPHSPKRVLQEIENKFGKTISARTLRRLARRSGRRWKRMRRSSKDKRDEQAFREAQCELEDLKDAHAAGKIDLWYMDAAGFSLDPTVPYAWQPVGEQKELPSTGSQRVNTVGFLSYDSEFNAYTFEGQIDTECVIGCVEDFCRSLTGPTFVVLDNAPLHKSEAFMERLEEWEERGLFFYFLPAYSPELNLIEVLWRMIKYHWLPIDAYDHFKKLQASLAEILSAIGTKYQVNFS